MIIRLPITHLCFAIISTRSLPVTGTAEHVNLLLFHCYCKASKTRSSADADKPARRDVTYSGQSTVWLRYILFNYRKAYCMPSTAVRGSACDVTSPTTAARFNCSVFHILPSEPHPDCPRCN